MQVTGTTSSAATGQSAAAAKLSETFDTFLTLLTKQLQYQDPLAPMDSTEFTSQLVQYSSVEQQLATNTKLDSLIDMQSVNQMSNGLMYLGTTVEAASSAIQLTEDGAWISYDLNKELTNVSLTVIDDTGKPVRTATAEGKAGSHRILWDGADNDGNALKLGTYTVQMTGLDANGNPVTIDTGTIGRVDGVKSVDGGTVLTIGGVSVPLTAVKSATLPSSSSGPGDSTDTTDGTDTTATETTGDGSGGSSS